jgi:DNA polymerase (family X)
MKLGRLEIAHALREISRLLAAGGGDRFRMRAYRHGAQALESFEGDFEELVRAGRLTSIPGVGARIAAIAEELRETGRSSLLEKLRADTPEGAVALGTVPGLTPRRRAKLLEHGIDDVDALKRACEEGRVREIPGFGEATERRLLEALRAIERHGTAMLLAQALDRADAFAAFARRHGATEVSAAGALRRAEELVDGLDFVVSAKDPAALAERLAKYPPALKAKTVDGVLRLDLAGGVEARIALATPATFAGELHRRTGSEAHLAKLAAAAQKDGKGEAPRKKTTTRRKTEAEIYAEAGLPFIPAELREDQGEIEEALAGGTFDDLVELGDVKGLIHCHTTWSDGAHSVLDMAQAADAAGAEYLTITDHSPAAHYARGVEIDRLKRQWDDIAAAQEQVKVKLLRGTESDILADGALDYPDAVLEKLDVVVASLHSGLRMAEDAMTKRVVAAMKLPVFKIWGHPSTRLLKRREPVSCRMEEIFDAMASSRAAAEINGDPQRLDLAPEWARAARRRGIPFVLSTDAHSTSELGNLRYAVLMARRAGVRKGEVLNTRPVAAFRRAVKPIR